MSSLTGNDGQFILILKKNSIYTLILQNTDEMQKNAIKCIGLIRLMKSQLHHKQLVHTHATVMAGSQKTRICK